MMEPISSGKSFSVLAGYIFGENIAEEAMTMTTPVITEGKSMHFVLPKSMSAEVRGCGRCDMRWDMVECVVGVERGMMR